MLRYHLERTEEEGHIRYNVSDQHGNHSKCVSIELVDDHYVLTCDRYGIHATPAAEGVGSGGVFGVVDKDSLEEAEERAREKGSQLIQNLIEGSKAPLPLS